MDTQMHVHAEKRNNRISEFVTGDTIGREIQFSHSWLRNDELHVILESEKGLGSLYISLNAPRGVVTCDVYGTKEILRIDLNRQIVLRQRPRGYSKFSAGKDSLSEACNLALFTMKNALQYSFRNIGERSFSNIYTMFIDSIRKGIESPVTPEMAFNTVRIVEEICKYMHACTLCMYVHILENIDKNPPFEFEGKMQCS